MIFKLQRALYPTDGDVLVYNKDRSYFGQIPMTPELNALFGDRIKVFVTGEVNDNGNLMKTMPCEDQPW